MIKENLIIKDAHLLHPDYKEQLLNWAQPFSSCCFLDNREYQSQLHRHNFLAGVGVVDSIRISSEPNLKDLDTFLSANKGKWIFGHLSYDLFSLLHGFSSTKQDRIDFALAEFFVPVFVVRGGKDELEIISQSKDFNSEACWLDILNTSIEEKPFPENEVQMKSRLSKQSYIKIIEQLRLHILRGDCYEINYCQEFFAEGVNLNPARIYEGLLQASPNPFSSFYKQGNSYLMCASPERYLTRREAKLLSQPIKGTAPRNLEDAEIDLALKDSLLKSAKERSENVMVVDLVRNDLSRVCEKGSVKVDELFGIYTYPQVHQMISTVSGLERKGIAFSELLYATFPMGSMTGAPKRRVMELIEQYEPSRRGLFSGAVGYFDPNGDFDFNVVIRSILYNAQNQYLSYQVGSGITWYSQPEKEYEECMWKANAIRNVLGKI